MLYNDIDVLSKRLLSLSIINKVNFISKKTNGNTYWQLKMMQECINRAFRVWVIIEYIAVKVAKLKDISFQSGVLKECCNTSFHQKNMSEDAKTLKMLHKNQ